MTDSLERSFPWRVVGWGGAVLLLAAPFVAMRFTSEVNWSVGDFIFAGVLLGLIGGTFELVVKASRSGAHRAGAGLALLATLLVIWTNLAVGIVGSERNPDNLWFFAALLVGIIGACVARFRAAGMSIAAAATALFLWIAFAAAVARPTDEPFVNHWVEFGGTSVFALLSLASAALFRNAARSVI